jgi:hypothetical protein
MGALTRKPRIYKIPALLWRQAYKAPGSGRPAPPNLLILSKLHQMRLAFWSR